MLSTVITIDRTLPLLSRLSITSQPQEEKEDLELETYRDNALNNQSVTGAKKLEYAQVI
jgi:hypothetical protein